MEVLKKLCVIENSCVGLGFFDGVHKGHSALIKKLVEFSLKTNTKSVVITFKKNPAEYFFKGVTYITSNEEKESLISSLGADYMFELDFNADLKNMSAEDYLNKIIYSNFKPKYILTGFNHTFGKGKCGTPEFLRANQEKYGYKYVEIPPVKYNDEIISSTLIRHCIENGDLKKANNLLGHDYLITGTVQKGNQIGRTIGFPTANIKYPETKPEIPYGVYSARVKVSDKLYRGMLNYGIKPTINGGNNAPVVEVHILDFDKDIYGEKIDISILEKIRNEKTFNSLNELKQQIKDDLKRC